MRLSNTIPGEVTVRPQEWRSLISSPLPRKALLSTGYVAYVAALLGFYSTILPAAAVSVYEPAVVPSLLLIASILVGGWVALSEGPLRGWGLLLAVLSVAAALAAPYIMGTFLVVSKDPIAHIRRTTHTLATGQFAVRRYAGFEAIAIALTAGAGGSIYRSASYYPLVSKGLFVVFTGFLVSCLMRGRGETEVGWDVGTFLVAAPVFGGSFAAGLYPEVAALHLVPFVAGASVMAARRSNLRTEAVLILAVMGFITFHPRMAAFGVAIAGMIYAGLCSERGWNRVIVPLILVTVWLAWFLYSPKFGSLVGPIADLFTPEGSTFSGNVQKAAALGLKEVVRFGLVAFSPFLVMALAAVPGLRSLPPGPTRPYVVTVAVVTAVGVLGLGAPIFFGSQALSRAGHATVLVLAVCLLAYLATRRPSLARHLAGALVLVSLGVSLVTVHRSPLMQQSSWHVDHGMMAGSQWITHHEDGTGLSAGLPTGLGSYYVSSTSAPAREPPRWSADRGAYPPEASPRDWAKDASFVVLHARIDTRCEHPVLGNRIIVGSPELHRPSLCRLLEPGATESFSLVYDSGIVTTYSGFRN